MQETHSLVGFFHNTVCVFISFRLDIRVCVTTLTALCIICVLIFEHLIQVLKIDKHGGRN